MLALSELHKKNALSVKKRAKIWIIFGISKGLANLLEHFSSLEDAEDDQKRDDHQSKYYEPGPT